MADNDFNKMIVKQCSNFFLGLSHFCLDYLEKIEQEGNGYDNANNGGRKSQKNNRQTKQGQSPNNESATNQGNRRGPAKKKRIIDPNMPKKPSTSFFLFRASISQKIKQEHQKATATDIAQLVSKEWRELPASKLKYWKDQYDENAKIYRIKVEEYKKN